MQYVLIIISYVWGGAAVHTQEFQTKERCEIARDAIKADSGGFKLYRTLECFQK